MASDIYQGIQHFIRTVETQNFSQVAREFRLTPSSVTRSISSLEDHLKVKLLHRSTRKVTPTDVGKRYYSQVKRIFHDLAQTHSELAGMDTQVKGVLRIGAPMQLGMGRLAPILPKFLKRYPELKIEAKYSDHYVDMLAESIDITIRVGIHKDSSLLMKKIEEYRRCLCASPSYLKKFGTPKKPEDFAKHQCLTFHNANVGGIWHFKRPQKQKIITVETQGPLHVNDTESLRHAALQGLGFILLPRWIVEKDLKEGRLVEVLEDTPANITQKFEQSLYAVYVGPKAPAKVRAFIDFLSEEWG